MIDLMELTKLTTYIIISNSILEGKLMTMKLKWNGIEFGRSWLKPEYRDLLHEPYYIYWFDFAEVPEYRMWGRSHFWYDGPHKWYCFWYFNVGWSTPWTKWNKE